MPDPLDPNAQVVDLLLRSHARPDESPPDALIRLIDERDTARAEAEFFKAAVESCQADQFAVRPMFAIGPDRPVSLSHTLAVGGKVARISVEIDDGPDGRPPGNLAFATGQPGPPVALSIDPTVLPVGLPVGPPLIPPAHDVPPEVVEAATRLRELAGKFRAWIDDAVAKGKAAQRGHDPSPGPRP